jgi:uncharacterized protein (UPF0332 family)
MTTETQSLIDWRLEQAAESLTSAQLLLDCGQRLGTMNSIYHGMLFCACALLATKDFNVQGGGGVLTKFDREFIKSGLLPKEIGDRFRLATQIQQGIDFGPQEPPTVERLKELLEDARSFLTATRLFLAKR